jgi:hypothetical protein
MKQQRIEKFKKHIQENNIKVIALGYKAQSGKDTFFDFAKEELGELNVVNLKFASGVYDGQYALQRTYGLPFVKERFLLQFIGDYFRKHHDPDFWIKQLERSLERQVDIKSKKHIIITDMRYKNEFSLLKEYGFTRVKIIRPGLHIESGAENHPSEIDLDGVDGWDIILKNDGSLGDYKEKVIKILKGE